MRKKIRLLARLRIALMVGLKAFRSAYRNVDGICLMKGDKLSVTYTLKIN